MDFQSPAVVFAVVGTVIGVFGGVLGTYFELRRARSAQDRTKVLGIALGLLLLIVAFIVAVLRVPPPWNALLWVPYALALAWAISAANRHVA